MASYSKSKFKSSGDKKNPCFIKFLVGNASDKCLPTQTCSFHLNIF
jgi:hypothetical protein